ncbi:hypothetical protein NET03_04885 [Thermomicrobium sp. CFH 73360]|uniref:hypothetical protein n=1 Tax=Thermomicrobium sp. CFH 73360 TaxID=2951987 RepID=UPI0020779394|nr:hypothetical protein [Thermomicrobium sp. CFH 73360]MCM8745858.1 hypothetical protein [Thermomicrobium sp. CFH 73360]
MTQEAMRDNGGLETAEVESRGDVVNVEPGRDADERPRTGEDVLGQGSGLAGRAGVHQEGTPARGEPAALGESRTTREEGALTGDPVTGGIPDSAAPLTASVPLDLLRSLVLRAYPEALPELVQGETLEALVASAERAVELRQRLLAEANAGTPVAAGAPRRVEGEAVARLSPLEKIRHAIAGRGS